MAVIASQSIKDGTSRSDGLQRFLAAKAHIGFARTNQRWPGRAATNVDLVAVWRSPASHRPLLNGREVDEINAFLSDGKDDGEPQPLSGERNRAFVGVALHGDGFVLDESEAHRLIKMATANTDVVKPFLIGDDLNGNFDLAPSRFVIDFSDLDETDAARYEAPFQIVRERVYPGRLTNNRPTYRVYWWRFGERRVALQAAIRSLPRYLVTAKTSKHLNFVFMSGTGVVLDQSLTILPVVDDWEFGIVQSTLHEAWARRYSSNQGGTPRYNATTAYQNFPFPSALTDDARSRVSELALAYQAQRAQLMSHYRVGLTELYNLFHARDLCPSGVSKFCAHRNTDPDSEYMRVLELRRLHVALDNAVRDAYAWQSLDLQHDFYEVETLPENDRVRYTISPAARKEVLKRLLALNHERAKAEQAAAAAPAVAKPARAKHAAAAAPVEEMTVFDQTFPNSSVDWETAAWMLALVRAAPRRRIAFYMACMTAAASPDLCEQILGQSREQETKRLMSKAPLAKLPNGTRVPFAAALRWASTTKAISTSASMEDAQPGPTFPRAVKEPEMPALDAALVALVIEVAEHATDATQVSQPWQKVFEQRRLLVG